eukprot:3015071-Prymnesium_polylepis.1
MRAAGRGARAELVLARCGARRARTQWAAATLGRCLRAEQAPRTPSKQRVVSPATWASLQAGWDGPAPVESKQCDAAQSGEQQPPVRGSNADATDASTPPPHVLSSLFLCLLLYARDGCFGPVRRRRHQTSMLF